jgi:putative SOS response-associated peptidase YedK
MPMCGRYVLAGPEKALDRLFGLPPLPGVLPRWNVAPGTPVVAIRSPGHGAREAFQPRWGFVPPWGSGSPIVNARAETAAAKPTFRAAFRDGRCLVPADAFYEWAAGRPKRPWVFRVDGGEPFAIAALASGETLALLTTDANDVVARAHGRMPLILDPHDHAAWLDPASDLAAHLTPLLRPFAAARMDGYPVGPAVNRAGTDGPELVAPAPPDGPPRQGTLF